MSFSLEGKLALVTGAARGLGLAVARELARRRARVVLTDIDEEGLEEARGTFPEAEIEVQRLDVTDAESIAALREHLRRTAGPVEILVNNAGIVHGGAFLDVPMERHEEVYSVNVLGMVAMTHAFLPDLLEAAAARLVNVASASGFLALPWAATYASSKWAAVGFSESIRLELAERGETSLRVTTVCPGYIDTGLFDGVRPPRGTRTLEPAEVARRIALAAQKGERLLLLPALARMVPLTPALPGGLADAISRWLGVATSMKNWRGRD